MVQVEVEGRRVPLLEGESVLDGLLRAGIEVPHGCRSGVCRACTMVCTGGSLPPQASAGSSELERRAGKFLACQCRPSSDLQVQLGAHTLRRALEILALDRLSESVVRVRARAVEDEGGGDAGSFEYEPGQYVNLVRSDGLARCYSLASVPREPWLELHVRRVPRGRMSGWLYDGARVGERVWAEGPLGSCCYDAALRERPLLMVAVGTGLAPIWGVLRAALERGHQGSITVVPAGLEPRNLYLQDELRALAGAHPQLRVRPCTLQGSSPGVETGSVEQLAPAIVREQGTPADWAAYLCGDAQLVGRLRMALFLAGVSARRIFADAFTPTSEAESSAA